MVGPLQRDSPLGKEVLVVGPVLGFGADSARREPMGVCVCGEDAGGLAYVPFDGVQAVAAAGDMCRAEVLCCG